jgi:LPS-assembly protein
VSLPLLSFSTELQLPDFKKKEDVFIEADNLEYDHENGVVTATGKVEIIKGGSALYADKILYNQKTDEVIADGNVSSIASDGSTIFVDRTKVKGDFKEGVIEFFRAKLSDGSQIAAASAKRINENKIILSKAVYSPCPICEGQENPQWQIKSRKVTYDKAAQKISYKDAFMEVYGVPVMYAPFFSHPTPDADAKSGFLPPQFRTDSNLGLTIKTPYYWNIKPNMDVTFEPVITTKEGLVAAGEFRHLTEYGKYKFLKTVFLCYKFNKGP